MHKLRLLLACWLCPELRLMDALQADFDREVAKNLQHEQGIRRRDDRIRELLAQVQEGSRVNALLRKALASIPREANPQP